MGWAPKGPTTKAVLVQSSSDYQRQFGELNSHSYLGYAVNQFFGNGGQQAYIVRLAWTDALTASATSVGGNTSPVGQQSGRMGDGLQIKVTLPSATAFN